MKGWLAVGVGVALALGAGEGSATVGLGGATGGAALLAPADCGPGAAAPCPSTGSSTAQASSGPLAVGAAAVSFTLAGVDGKPVAVTPSAGMKPVVLAFWSMFCEPCRDELPMVARLAGKYGDRGSRW